MLFRVCPILGAIEFIVKRDPFAAFGLTDFAHNAGRGEA
jgi:hypothetical protein